MVVRGARASLARARVIRSARRSRSSRALSKSSSRSTSSSRTSSSSSTQSTSQTKQTKQIALYEEVQKAADELQDTAKALIKLGSVETATATSTTTSATTTAGSTATTTTDATASTTTTTTDTAASTTTTAATTTTDATTSSTTTATTTTQTNTKTEEELKKEIIAGVKDMVKQYNIIYNNLDDLGGTVNTLYVSQLKSLLSNSAATLEKAGVVVNKDGTLSITDKTLEGADLSTLKEVFCKSGGITEKLMNKCEKIESNASSTISVINRMYGTSTYNKYGTSSSYYGSSGSWYNALS